jgi:hypothetical protein
MGCRPVAVVIMHVYEIRIWDINCLDNRLSSNNVNKSTKGLWIVMWGFFLTILITLYELILYLDNIISAW